MKPTTENEQMLERIRAAADSFLQEGMEQTKTGMWQIGWQKIEGEFGERVTPTNEIGQRLLEEMRLHEEVARLSATEYDIEINYHLECCPQCRTKGDGDMLKLFSLMDCNLENVFLVHGEEELDTAAVVELNQDTLAEEGKEEWADVLGAAVRRIYHGYYGTQIEMVGCSPQRLQAFSYMLTGHYPEKEYNRWVQAPPKKAEPAYKSTKAINLIATLEEFHHVPDKEKLTYYLGDYGTHFLKPGISDEQVKAAYDEGLRTIRMDGDTFQKTDDFIYRGEILKRMRSCALAEELTAGERVFFIPSEPLIGALGFRVGGGLLDEIDPEALTCTVIGEEINGSMELPLYNVIALRDPDGREQHFGLKHVWPLYGADDVYVRDMLLQAEERWEKACSQEEAPALSM